LLAAAFSASVSRGIAGSGEVEGVVDDEARLFLCFISPNSMDFCWSSRLSIQFTLGKKNSNGIRVEIREMVGPISIQLCD
jgi:hypothetical protein